jgi:hypothetical protein
MRGSTRRKKRLRGIPIHFQIAVALHNFENFFEKVNEFNTVSGGFPPLRPIQANNQYTTPQKIEAE